jgi:hypothetical protein
MDYNFIEDFSKEMVLHLIKDLEILQNINISNIDNIDNMCNIDNNRNNINKRNIDLINERRLNSENKYEILKIHNFIANQIDCKQFTNYVDFETIKYLRSKKEYLKCEELIAKMLLRKEYKALYELALIKIDQRNYSEGKDILKRYISILKSSNDTVMDSNINLNDCIRNDSKTDYSTNNVRELFKTYNKILDVSKSVLLFETFIFDLEEAFFRNFIPEQNHFMKLSTSSSKFSNLEKYKAMYTFSNSIISANNASNTYNNISNNISNNIAYNNVNNNISNKNTSNTYNNITKNNITNNNVSNNANNNTNSGAMDCFKYLQKIYFLSDKHFDKSDNFLSIQFYFKSFNSNYEAIPRFFHKISDVSKVYSKQLAEMNDFIILYHLSD